MITNYYTLKALVEEWKEMLVGGDLGDAFSQEPGELSLAFTAPDGDQMVRIGTRQPFQFMFRADGYSKARRNVATLFEEAFGRRVESVSIADRDRMIYFELEGALSFRIPLYGPRANVVLVNAGRTAASFQDGAELTGTPAPSARPAPSPDTLEAFVSRWREDRKSVAHALSSACPLFDRTLGAEAAARAGVNPHRRPQVGTDVLAALFEASEEVRADLSSPTPRIYWHHKEPVQFSLIDLQAFSEEAEERFDDVDGAVRVFVRRTLARRRFRELYDPIEEALIRTVEHDREAVQRMRLELSQESRADQYERWGHLLMARAGEIPKGQDQVELHDLFSGRGTVTVPLDPARSAVENAQAYYDRARRTRRSREEAEGRLVATEERSRDAERLLELVQEVDDLREVRAFRKTHADRLARFLPDEKAPGDRVPFRRFDLPGGYQVWVGRNARQNDELTFHHAQKYDLWMHARGVPGSHAVLRLPHRGAEPGRAVIQQAASVAAYYSKARGSGLVPVTVAERKYVRKPKGAPAGGVAVEREDVLLVEPRLPD